MKIKNINELLCDDEFLAWYFKTDQVKMDLWESRIKMDTEQKKIADEAILILEKVKIKEENIDTDVTGRAASRLFENIKTLKSHSTPSPVRSMNKRRWLRWVAAAIFLVTIGLGLLKYSQPAKPVIETSYAEIKSESLPDGSQVTLNANSKITYGKSWKKENDREVWVNGEAFFQVQKTPQKSKFIVHTGHFDIIVTGTQFNVVNRDEKTNVLLKEGSVIIRTADGKETKMKPGDFMEFSNDQMQKREAKDAQVLAWKDRKFIFEKTPMKEVGASMKDLYGVNVRFGDNTAATDSISCIVPNDNLDIFLQYLETSQNYEIIKNNQEVLISTRKRR
ncbi:MAG: FecR domain-containing protein [Chitinophagaceae bacterium]